MTDAPIKHKTKFVTVDGTTTSYTFALPNEHGGNLGLHFDEITGLTGVVTVSFDGGTDYYDIESVTSAGVIVASGGTHTAVDGESLYFDAPTATHVKYSRSAGDGAVQLVSFYDATNSIYSILRAIRDAGIAVTITQPDAIVGPADPVVDSYATVAINLEPAADNVLVSSAASKQIWVYGYHVMLDIAGSASFQDEDNTAISGIMPFGINGGATVSPGGNFAMPIFKLATNKDLEIDVVTADLDGWLSYAIISV